MDLDIEKYKGKNSSRHHYVPQFLISGFTNSNGELYIYDKIRDKIQNKPKPPKSIFFENDRNTIILPDKSESSIIEDYLFKEIDNTGSIVVKYFQDTQLDKIKFNDENIAQFLYFLVCLFWRIPKNDLAVKELVKSADIKISGIDSNLLKKDEAFQKSQVSGIIRHTLNEMISRPENFKKIVNIHQLGNSVLMIGDNPLLFRKLNPEFSLFGKEDFLIALTSNRIFSSTETDLGILSLENAVAYNTAVINQSVRYVCCGDLDVLEKSIKTYNMVKNKGLNAGIQEVPFMIIK